MLLDIPIMLLVGISMEHSLIRFFYKRPHAEQILVTFGLVIVLREIIKAFYGVNPIPISALEIVSGSAPVETWFGFGDNVIYP